MIASLAPAAPFVVACAVFVALLLWAERRESALGRWLTKPLASLSFVAVAYVTVPLESLFGELLFAGLCLSAIGDVLLIRMESQRWFVAGTAVFLAAHLAYGAAFLSRGVAPFAASAASLLVLAAVAGVLQWLLPKLPRAMRIPIVAYAIVISSMVVVAVGTVAAHGGPWLVVGALAFYLSDLSVARDRFVSPGFVNRALGLPLYYGAQLALSLGAVDGR